MEETNNKMKQSLEINEAESNNKLGYSNKTSN